MSSSRIGDTTRWRNFLRRRAPTNAVERIDAPVSVATDAAGDVFVASMGNNTVEEFSSAGALVRTLSSGIDGPASLATDAGGDVFVANSIGNTVEEFLPIGVTTVNDDSTSVTVTETSPTFSVATFLSEQSSLDDLPYGFSIADTASNVAASLDQLNADMHINSIAFTDGSTPTLTLSIEEALNDTHALSEITSPFAGALADTAANIELITSTQASALQADGYTSIAATSGPVAMTITEATYLSSDGIAVTGAPVVVSGAVATMAALATTEAATLVSEGYTLAVLDTAADIRAMTVTQISALAARDVLQVNASDFDGVAEGRASIGVGGRGDEGFGSAGDFVLISGAAARLETLTANQIDGLPAIGVTGLAIDRCKRQLLAIADRGHPLERAQRVRRGLLHRNRKLRQRRLLRLPGRPADQAKVCQSGRHIRHRLF